MRMQEPKDHPSLARYPGGRTTLYREDEHLWRVPADRDKDEAVPVPVQDLAQAVAALHQLKVIIDSGVVGEDEIRTVGDALMLVTSDPTPQARGEVSDSVKALRERLQGWLPYW